MAPKKRPAAAKPPAAKKRPAAAKQPAAKKRPAAAKKPAAKKRPASVKTSPLKRPAKSTRLSEWPLAKVTSCPHSAANFSEAKVLSMKIELKVDFDRQVLFGICELGVRTIAGATELVLDVLGLAIQDVSEPGPESDQLTWEIEDPPEPKSHFGQALRIHLSHFPSKDNIHRVSIRYVTTAKSTALQWLTKDQTQGKEHPLCFTQSQAICARSIFPCQDTPSVKSTFYISVEVPSPLTAVASGNPVSPFHEVRDGQFRIFSYEQKVPVMSYLVAFVVGRLDCCEIGPRSKCYAEPGVIKAAQKEFEDIVEEFIVTAQEVVGGAKYEWGSYNVAIMPSSFAYGGMENPNCTFMSASLIPGDRSLTPTLAHETVHSWIGNLVTNALWKDFWLNEGFTRYIERRILSKIYGPAFRGLLLLVGYNDLIKTVDMLNKQGTPGLTRLEPEIDKIDPDDAFSRIPYEKGSLFLFYLEQIVGGEKNMTDYLRSYIHAFRGRSIQTEDMKAHFLHFFRRRKRIQEIDWEHWLHGEGLPDFDLADYVDRSLVDESISLAESWLKTGTSDAETVHMKAQQWMLFLDHLINAIAENPISHSTLAEMDSKYKLSATSNVEVSFRWCLLGCKLCWPGCLALTEQFLGSHGRGVYVKPLYLALKAFDQDKARAVFQQNRNFYMTVVTRQIAAFLD